MAKQTSCEPLNCCVCSSHSTWHRKTLSCVRAIMRKMHFRCGELMLVAVPLRGSWRCLKWLLSRHGSCQKPAQKLTCHLDCTIFVRANSLLALEVYTYTHTSARARTHTHAHTHVHAHTHTPTHTYNIHTRTRTHTHTH